MYKAQQQGQTNQGSDSNGEATGGSDDVEDVDFEEVKE